MKRMYVVCEGQTEETFVRDVIAPIFAHRQIYITARLISTSKGHKGGGLNYQRVKKFILNSLKEEADTIITTFFDLYALDNGFPSYEEGRKISDVHQRVARLEDAFKADVVKENELYAERFSPYIQPYEFEGLLFTDIAKLIELETSWEKAFKELNAIRDSFSSPEHINDGYETKPSARINGILQKPSYRKIRHGSLAIKNIGIDNLCEQCTHFAEWYHKLNQIRCSA
ncbi:MAG: DUF4276 family protein [Gammaproteobacteria bacterium]|nr:DUF4276 family protein [Gammaproteobacteria bacterium]